MKSVLAFGLILTVAGCAHSEKKSAVTETPAETSSIAPPAPFSPELRMPLPYTFTRRGVRLRVNSVEFAKEEIKVSVSLQESRGQAVTILTSTLMEPQTDSKKVMVFSGYDRDASRHTSPELQLTPNEKLTLDLMYKWPADTNGGPITIQFTTGKWWSSAE